MVIIKLDKNDQVIKVERISKLTRKLYIIKDLEEILTKEEIQKGILKGWIIESP